MVDNWASDKQICRESRKQISRNAMFKVSVPADPVLIQYLTQWLPILWQFNDRKILLSLKENCPLAYAMASYFIYFISCPLG